MGEGALHEGTLFWWAGLLNPLQAGRGTQRPPTCPHRAQDHSEKSSVQSYRTCMAERASEREAEPLRGEEGAGGPAWEQAPGTPGGALCTHLQGAGGAVVNRRA